MGQLAKQESVVSAKFRNWRVQWPYLLRALELVWTAAGKWTAAWLAVLAIQGILPISIVYLTRTIVNAMMAAIRAGASWQNLQPLAINAAAVALVLAAGELLRGLAGLLRAMQADLVQDHISALIQEKSATVDLAFYEWPKFYDHLHRAREDAGYRPVALVESLGNLFQNCIPLSAILLVLLPFGPWLPLTLLFSAAPAFFVVLRYAVQRHHWQRQATPEERWSWYYDWVLTDKESAAEVRLFDLREYFRKAFDSRRRTLRRGRLKLARSQSVAELTAGLAGLALTGLALVPMGYRAVRGSVTLGDLALFYQAFQQGQGLVRSLLDHVGHLYQNSLFLGNLFEFLSLQPRIADPPKPLPGPLALQDGIRFRQVTFSYPARKAPILRQFDLLIPAGQIVTIVGPNGAGKSTLIKLLCRLYDPQEGSIEWDGVDLRSMSVASLRKQIATLFQEPVHYSATVEDNIAISDVRAGKDRPAIERVARAAGAEGVVSGLPQKYETLLGNWFEEGTELSVGEWQRVGLARAFWRQSPLILFDEPSSAMDPWAEAEWLSRFRELVHGRTALIITHRFTSAKFADMIHVMTAGQIVESGTHEELLARGGIYAQGWAHQIDDQIAGL